MGGLLFYSRVDLKALCPQAQSVLFTGNFNSVANDLFKLFQVVIKEKYLKSEKVCSAKVYVQCY